MESFVVLAAALKFSESTLTAARGNQPIKLPIKTSLNFYSLPQADRLILAPAKNFPACTRVIRIHPSENKAAAEIIASYRAHYPLNGPFGDGLRTDAKRIIGTRGWKCLSCSFLPGEEARLFLLAAGNPKIVRVGISFEMSAEGVSASAFIVMQREGLA